MRPVPPITTIFMGSLLVLYEDVLWWPEGEQATARHAPAPSMSEATFIGTVAGATGVNRWA
jgi:hypothetical protein